MKSLVVTALTVAFVVASVAPVAGRRRCQGQVSHSSRRARRKMIGRRQGQLGIGETAKGVWRHGRRRCEYSVQQLSFRKGRGAAAKSALDQLHGVRERGLASP